MDTKTKEIAKAYDAAHQLNRIADALEEVLRLVKADQEKMAKRFPDEDKE
jgi:negative regulator of sigma E activity